MVVVELWRRAVLEELLTNLESFSNLNPAVWHCRVVSHELNHELNFKLNPKLNPKLDPKLNLKPNLKLKH